MEEMGFKQLLPEHLQAPIIITFMQPKNPGFKFDQFYDSLSKKGFLIYPGKLTIANTFRIGCIGYLNSNDMLEALKAIKKTIQELNIQLN